ncbi:MAG: hypothetical protein ACI4WY_01485 [Anaerovoracaceae bacterium]
MGTEYRKLVDERIRRAFETGSSETALSSKTYAPGYNSDAENSKDDGLRMLMDAACRQRETRRRILRRRAVSVAAVFACVFFLFGSLYMKGFFAPEETQAGRIPDTAVNLENGSVVIGGDGNGNTEMWTATFTEYNDIPNVYQKEMVWFDYIPEGYSLRSVKIKTVSNFLYFEIFFEAEGLPEVRVDESLSSSGENNKVTTFHHFQTRKKINGMDVYLKEDKETIYYALSYMETEIHIKSDKEMENEIEAMIASIRTGLNKL